jgi:hypothetical protein
MEAEDEDAKLDDAGCGSETEPQNEFCLVVNALRLARCLRYMVQGWSLRASTDSCQKFEHCVFHGPNFKRLLFCRVNILINYLVSCALL